MKLLGLFCVITAYFTSNVSGRELNFEKYGANPHQVDIRFDGQNGLTQQRQRPRSCQHVSQRVSGVYWIQPEWPFKAPMLVYCDQQYESGGWAVIQRRFDGSLEFDRGVKEYNSGFGNLDAEFWLGLENIFRLVNVAPHELIVLLEDFAGNTSYARYDGFKIHKYDSYIVPQYSLDKIGQYSGTAGNGFDMYDSERYFRLTYSNAGFWPNSVKSNLNGLYTFQPQQRKSALFWNDLAPGSIKATKIMVRPVAPPAKLKESDELIEQ